ncbi:MAG: IS1634 family transposase, partial [Sphaerospermopsis kisseleviana]
YNTSLPEVIFESQKVGDNQELEEIAVKSPKEITITYGYSRDHRPDLILKDPLFFADSIFLKSPERIESLGMIMGLCLLVYTLAQRQIRNALKASQSAIKNQLGKATNRPTLRWIFQCFQCIHLVTLNQEEHISNWNKDRDFILRLLPDDCLRYYQLVT